MPRGPKTIIHWTDPRYLEEFYKAWGSGQSTTVRQQARVGETDKPDDTLTGSEDDDE